MTAKDRFAPLSLDQYFVPPDGYKAEFGWIVGYSADAAFLNRAAERFTGYTDAQRAYAARIQLAVMLDPSHPQIPPVDVPGVLHLPFRDVPRRYRMLHAKVALLAFTSTAGEWVLRLVVSTGNWTRSTLETSLDLAWATELSSADDRGHTLSRLSRADIHAAWSMVCMVRADFDDRALDGVPAESGKSETRAVYSRSAALLDTVQSARGVKSRFVDSRTASLLDRVVARVPAPGVARNSLVLGSGFFQGASTQGRVPSVLTQVVNSLVSRGLMTKTAAKDLFCNPRACQSVADSLTALSKDSWTVREPGLPSFFQSQQRDFHAKFLFGFNEQQGSPNCSSPWIYLGSGNLTEPGFTRPMSPAGGNLEAGVVFDPGKVVWRQTKRTPPSRLITNLLPVQWDTDPLNQASAVGRGPQMPDPGPDVLAGPLGWLSWLAIDADAGLLQAPDDADLDGVEVLDGAGQPCVFVDRAWRWPSEQPRQATLRWRDRTIIVPVIDVFGRVAGAEMRRLDLDEAWAQLSIFPHPPEDEEHIDQDLATTLDNATPPEQRQRTSSYPIRRVMQLVERIADQQTAISARDWSMWCNRLEAVLGQAATDPNIAAFHSLNLNPLSPLRHSPFRPTFAESDTTPEGIAYEAALAKVEDLWGVAGLQPLGGLA